MNESVIAGVFALSGTILGGLISYLIARDEKKTRVLKSQVNTLSKQIISYWNLEKKYSEELSNLTSKSQKTILQEYREKIEEIDMERPTMTEKEAKRILNKNS